MPNTDALVHLRELVAMDKASHDAHTDGYVASAHHCLTCFDIATKEQAADEIERLRTAIDSVIEALDVEGRCPPQHRAVMRKHRYEWPVLWRAIDALRKARRAS